MRSAQYWLWSPMPSQSVRPDPSTSSATSSVYWSPNHRAEPDLSASVGRCIATIASGAAEAFRAASPAAPGYVRTRGRP